MIKIIQVPLYRCAIVCLIESSVEEWKKWYKQQNGKIDVKSYADVIEELNSEGNLGFAFQTEYKDHIFAIKEKRIDLLVHEAFHTANSILYSRGYVPDETAEPLAYLLEFIVKELLLIINGECKGIKS